MPQQLLNNRIRSQTGTAVVQGSFFARSPSEFSHSAIRGADAGGPQPVFRSGMFSLRLPDSFLNLQGRRSGQVLPTTVQRRMESLFRTDFSDVRVHVGPEASALGAEAFALGSDLYFSPSRYQPMDARGQQLIAHELTHVVQQRRGFVENPFGQGIALVQDPALEVEADRMRILAGKHPSGDFVPRSEAPKWRLIQDGRRLGTVQLAAATDRAETETEPAVSAAVNPRQTGYPTMDLRMYSRYTGGKEKDIYLLERGRAAAVSKTGDVRRVTSEVSTLHRLKKFHIPCITVGSVMMFQTKHRSLPGFLMDWVSNSIDSNADPAGFERALRGLRGSKRMRAVRDLNRIENYVRAYGGILDLQLILDPHGRLRILDPRGEIPEVASSFFLLQKWRKALASSDILERKR